MAINFLRPAAILPVAVFSDCCILSRIFVSFVEGKRVEAYAGILLRIVNISDIARLFHRAERPVLAAKATTVQVITVYQSIVLQKALITVGCFVVIGLICIVDEKMQKPQNTSTNEPSSF